MYIYNLVKTSLHHNTVNTQTTYAHLLSRTQVCPYKHICIQLNASTKIITRAHTHTHTPWTVSLLAIQLSISFSTFSSSCYFLFCPSFIELFFSTSVYFLHFHFALISLYFVLSTFIIFPFLLFLVWPRLMCHVLDLAMLHHFEQ